MKQGDCEQLFETLFEQLKDQFRIVRGRGQCIVVTPMMFPDNTKISLSVEISDDHRVTLTDNGEAADYAFVNGLGEPTIRDRVRKTVKRLHLVEDRSNELMLTVPSSEVADGIVSLATAVQDVGYLVYRRSSARPQRQFKEGIESFLTLSDRSFTKHVSIPGRTGMKTFDYEVSGTGIQQLLLATFEATTQRTAIDRAKLIAFDYGDIHIPSSASQVPPLVVLYDDTNDRVRSAFSEEVEAILSAHASKIIPWTRRERIDSLFIAA